MEDGVEAASTRSASLSDKSLNGIRCLVLGGGGFLGSNLCRALVESGARVQAFGRSPTFPQAIHPKVIWSVGDFRDAVALSKAVGGQQVVFNLMGGSVPESSNRDPIADLVASTVSTLHLLEICRIEGIQKIIFVSSGGTVYGVLKQVPVPESAPTDPIVAYGISRLAIEKYLALYRHLHGLEYQILRVANPYGRFQSPHKKQGIVATQIYRALNGEPLEIWGTGEVVRDFIHVDDVTRAFLSAIHYTGIHRVMNVGSGQGRSVIELIKDIETLLGRGTLHKTFMPARSADVPVNILDITLIAREMAWSPQVSWLDGLKDTIRWMSTS